MKKYVCMICGYVYDEAVGIPSAGIAPGTKWEELSDDWVCPLCGAAKSDFKEQILESASEKKEEVLGDDGEPRKMTTGELSVLFSNLGRGCEKQYLAEESALFMELSAYFKEKTPKEEVATSQVLYELLQNDLNEGIEKANAIARANADRGTMRVLVWGEKVSRMMNSILSRYQKEGDSFLENTNIYVCDTCGFIYVGDDVPELCPVCKVPSWKIGKVERR